METLIDWAGRWQMLAVALIALVAALTTAIVLRWNVGRRLASQRKEQDDCRAHRLRAVQAAMPADLSTIVSYTEESVNVSVKLLEGIRSQSTPWVREHIKQRKLTYPTLPSRVISNLHDLIELLDGENAKLVTELLGCFQIQHAQLADKVTVYNQPQQDGLTKVLTEHNIEYTIKNTVELYLRAASMLDFAEGRKDRIGARIFTSGDVSSALLDLGVVDAISREYERELCRTFVKERHVSTS